MNENVAKRNRLLAEKVIKGLESRNMKGYSAESKEEALKKAWELIDAAGCRGMKVGGAAVSEKHCNFLVNENGATADDIENLGEKIVKQVLEKTGVTLEWEVIRLGEKGGNTQG